MKIYQVGGAVRDRLLGLPVQDRDFVVIGATPEQMLAQGFLPVGKDFPVFLHPQTHEEYALARTERKTAPGYKGFAFHAAPDITLEQDLSRRDLTINAMALDEAGNLIDPFGGKSDLEKRIFRHVSDAFAEDPVRILRLARFAARFPEFTIAAPTHTLMQSMVACGEVDALVPERVWQELARGLMERMPSRMFQVLRDCGALARILPELDKLWGVPQPPLHHPEIDTGIHIMQVIDYAAKQQYSLPIRVAALMHDLGKGVTPAEQWPSHHGHEELASVLIDAICRRLKMPNDCRDLAKLAAREHGNISRALTLRGNTVVKLFERCDAFRKPQRFLDILTVAECDFYGRGGREHLAGGLLPQTRYLMTALDAARMIDSKAIAAQYHDRPEAIAQAIHTARVVAVNVIIKGQN